MKRAGDEGTKDPIWLAPRDTVGLLTVNIEGQLYKVPERLYRHMTTLANMVADMGDPVMLRGAVVDLPITNATWERVATHINVIDLWAADRELCLTKLTPSLHALADTGVPANALLVDLLVVVNFLDCELLMTCALDVLVGRLKSKSYYGRNEKPRDEEALNELAVRLRGDYLRPLVLSHDSDRLLEAERMLTEHNLPVEVRNVILRKLLPKQAPQIASGPTGIILTGARGNGLYIFNQNLHTWDLVSPGGSGNPIISAALNAERTLALVSLKDSGSTGAALVDVPRPHTQRLDQTTLNGDLRQVVCGDGFVLVLTSDGVYGCGDNTYGQLAQAATRLSNTQVFVKLAYGLEGTPLRIAAGGKQTMIQTDVGLFVCGNNASNQLGIGKTSTHIIYRLTQLELPLGAEIISFSCGTRHCAVLTSEGLYVAGDRRSYSSGTAQQTKLHRLDTSNVGPLKGAYCGPECIFVWGSRGCYAAGVNDRRQLGEAGDGDEVVKTLSPMFGQYDSERRWEVASIGASAHKTVIAFATGEIIQLPGARTGMSQIRTLTIPALLQAKAPTSPVCASCSRTSDLWQEQTGLRRHFCREKCQPLYYDVLWKAMQRLDLNQ